MEKDNNIELLDRFFDGTATKPEVQYLLEQLKDAQFEQTWMQEQWNATTDKMNPKVQQRIFENIKQINESKQVFHWKKWIAVAASFLLVLTTSLSVYFLYEGQSRNFSGDMIVTAQKGQKVTVTLSDGSRVWVNSGSKLAYGSRYNQKERMINLEGEAYFEVVKNKNAPFIVHSNNFSVKALGTAFDVKAYPEDKKIVVSLINGKVEVGDNDSKTYLMPNQRVLYDCVSKNMVKTDVEDCSVYAEWRNNRLNFESDTFEEIASMLERNYNIRFVFESPGLKKFHYSGSLSNTNIESVLQAFALTSPLQYQIKDSAIYLKENKEMVPFYQHVMK
ncbi:MAG: FecR family protein [Bacteroidales bacterium]|nr:FecR family protein [Bacteroidales bacterium]